MQQQGAEQEPSTGYIGGSDTQPEGIYAAESTDRHGIRAGTVTGRSEEGL